MHHHTSQLLAMIIPILSTEVRATTGKEKILHLRQSRQLDSL